MAAEAAAKLGVPSAATTSVAAGTTAAGTTGRKGSDASDTTSEARVPSSKKRGAGSAAAAGEASEGVAASSGKSGKSSNKESKKSKRRKDAAAAGEGAGEPAAAAEQQQQGEAAAEGQPAKKQRIVIEPAVAQSGPVYPFVPTPATGENGGQLLLWVWLRHLLPAGPAAAVPPAVARDASAALADVRWGSFAAGPATQVHHACWPALLQPLFARPARLTLPAGKRSHPCPSCCPATPQTCRLDTHSPAGWWGEKRFASAGCLEGLDKTAAEAARRRMTFNEDDQVRRALIIIYYEWLHSNSCA